MLKPTDKVLCCCRKGQVRSVAARLLLCERWGFRRVVAVGLENTDSDTLAHLSEWAYVILVVGSTAVWDMSPWFFKRRAIFVNVGPDFWGSFNHPELLAKLEPMIERLVKE